jgi:hypothetical protein
MAACASAPPRPPPSAPPAESSAPEEELEPEGDDAPASSSSTPMVTLETPERTRAASTASYEQALSSPEKLDPKDDRVHLTDSQLRAPMGGVLNGCGVPRYAKVVIKTAVQHGRAIGVTVEVKVPHAPQTKAKHPSPAAAKAAAKAAKREAKAIKKTTLCIDHAVRAVVWPPSNRRDSFTTEF